MPDPSIAIVVPVHNRESIVTRTLDSIYAQTYRPLHLVLVDNNSTDGTMEVLTKWADEHRGDDFTIDIVQEPIPGAAAARNAGIARVTQDWIMHFDSDDTMQPHHVERAMGCVRQHRQAQIIGWDVMLHGADGKTSVKAFEYHDLMYYNVMSGCFATLRYMVKTELLRKAGGWNATVKVWNDIELGARLLMQQPIIYKVNGEPSVDVYYGQESLTGPDFWSRREGLEHALDVITEDLGPEYGWITNMKRAVLAADYYKEGHKEDAERLMTSIQDQSRWRRMVYRWAYRYARMGMRGAAVVFRMLI